MRLNLDLLKEGGVQIDVLRAIGGGAKSSLWLQLKADITGIPVVVPKVTETAGLGAAVLAGVGAGVFPDARQAIERIIKFEKRIEPQPENASAYQNKFELYRDIYPAVKGIFHRL